MGPERDGICAGTGHGVRIISLKAYNVTVFQALQIEVTVGARRGFKCIGGGDIIQNTNLFAIDANKMLGCARLCGQVILFPLQNTACGKGERGCGKILTPLHALGGKHFGAVDLNRHLGGNYTTDKMPLVHRLETLHLEYHSVNLSVLQHIVILPNYSDLFATACAARMVCS